MTASQPSPSSLAPSSLAASSLAAGAPPVVRTVAALRATVAQWRQQGLRVALIPTMGALHDGHLSLVRHARTLADRTVTSIFVNPTQFGPAEDFSRYPRDEDADRARLAEVGCDLLFAPDAAAMYPAGFATVIDVGPVALPLEGRFRPGHFQGVATVVAKLLLQTLPDVACFGEKDYQQLQVIRRLVSDLDIPVRIEGVPTVRDADGLALSSRNRYLSETERQAAVTVSRVLKDLVATLSDGRASVASAVAAARATLEGAGFGPIDYVAVVDAETLEDVARLDRPARALVAAFLGRTRLIDNMAVPVSPPQER